MIIYANLSLVFLRHSTRADYLPLPVSLAAQRFSNFFTSVFTDSLPAIIVRVHS